MKIENVGQTETHLVLIEKNTFFRRFFSSYKHAIANVRLDFAEGRQLGFKCFVGNDLLRPKSN